MIHPLRIYCLFSIIQITPFSNPVMPPIPVNHPPPQPALAHQNSANDSRFPCGTCDKSVTWSQRGVVCESCGQWFHLGCQDYELDTNEYERLGESETSWRCIICDNANHSTTAFDLHGLSNERHEHTQSDFSNATIDSNIDTSFHPFHASTPTRSSKQDRHSRRPLRFLTVNCRSIVGKTVDFENLTQSIKPDVILGTVSWLSSKITNA